MDCSCLLHLRAVARTQSANVNGPFPSHLPIPSQPFQLPARLIRQQIRQIVAASFLFFQILFPQPVLGRADLLLQIQGGQQSAARSPNDDLFQAV